MKKRSKSPFLVLLCCILAVPTCGFLTGQLALPIEWTEDALNLFKPWLLVGALLGLAHLLLRPVLRLLSAPVGCVTLGLSGFVIDVALIYLSAYFVEEFAQPSLLYAVLTALLINAICAITNAR